MFHSQLYAFDDTGYEPCSLSGEESYTAQLLREKIFPPSITPDQLRRLPDGIFPNIEKCQKTLLDLLFGMEDQLPPEQKDQRPLRSTGAALSAAVSLLECTIKEKSARIMLFTGGPCTHGPGKVVGENPNERIRTHDDIAEGNAKYMESACQHYKALAERACKLGYVIDVFACGAEQVGLSEMKAAPSLTGGHVVMAASFRSPQFQQSFEQLFAPIENGSFYTAYNGVMQISAANELRVARVIGPCVQEGASRWKFNTLNSNTTVAIYFELTDPVRKHAKCFIRFHANLFRNCRLERSQKKAIF